jgi:hypothetical protein
MNVLHGPMQGPIGGFTVGGTRTAAAGGPALLVGDQAVRSLDGATLTDGYAVYYVWSAVSSGTALKGFARVQGLFGDANGKMVVWDNSGTVLQVSSPAVIPEAGGLVEFAFAGLAIAQGTSYKIGYIADGYTDVGTSAATWELGYEANNYATPASNTGTAGDVAYGIPEIYLMTG